MDKKILIHISQLVTPVGKTARHGSSMKQVKKIEDAAIVIMDGIIAAVGTTAEILAKRDLMNVTVRDMSGKTILPGFVDSHTHFVFGGYRPEEFMMRLSGVPYIEIHKRGGGIQNSVEATRALKEEEMYELGRERLFDMLSMGVTTVEGKSGYGLDAATELKQLTVMAELDQQHPVDVVRTFMGAHAIPAEYKGRTDDFVDYLLLEVLPLVAERQLAEFCDVFCEKGVFSVEQSRRLLTAAQAMGIKAKVHADEIVTLGGAELAAEISALSVTSKAGL